MDAETGTPLSGQQRAQASSDLLTLTRTAEVTRQLVEGDGQFTAESLRKDIAAMEAILRRLRRSMPIGAAPGE